MHAPLLSLNRPGKLAGLVALLGLSLATPAQAGLIAFEFTVSGNTNTPTFQLTNQSTNQLITGFTLTIGDTTKNWDYVTNFLDALGGSHVLLSPDLGQDGVRSDVIALSFTGFGTGEFVKFDADLDRDATPQNSVEDFHTVLFNNGASGNAVATVTFSSGNALSLELPDGPAANASYTFSTSAPVPDGSSTLLLALVPLGTMALIRSRRFRQRA